MRALMLCCWFAIGLPMMGCGSHECTAPANTEAKADETECKTGDCCANLSRAALLQKSVENKSPDE